VKRIAAFAAFAFTFATPALYAKETTQHRAVTVLKFSDAPTNELPSTLQQFPMSDIRAAMTADFTTIGAPSSSPALHNWTQKPATSETFLRIPTWMKTGLASATVSARLIPPSIGSPCNTRPYQPSNILKPMAEDRRRILYPLVQQTACAHGLPVALMDAMLMQESGYNPYAISPKGALGLGQLMPNTAKMLGVNPHHLGENLNGAARYLRSQLNEFGRYDLALAAYNSGPGRVRKVGRIPYIRETQDYVRIILSNWRQLEQSNGAP
jgi:hypothetical protein